MLGFTSLCEAKTIRDIFANEPNDIFMILPSRYRLDMLDYFDAGKIVTTKTDLTSKENGAKLNDVNQNFISVALTTKNDVDLQLITSAKDSIIVVVNTAKLPARDSQISFYNTDWKKLNTKSYFNEPTLADFIMKSATKEERKVIFEKIKFPIIYYKLSPSEPGKMTAILEVERFLNKEDWELIKKNINTSINYTYSGKYKKTKE